MTEAGTAGTAVLARERELASRPRPRRTRPSGLLPVSLLVAAVLVVPLAFLLVEAQGAGVGKVASLIDRSLTAQLLWNTVRLSAVVTALCAVIGTGAAWLTERTDLPGRRVWAVLLVVPLAIPDFVVSFGWASLSNDVSGFRGAVLVMTLAVYPLVYLPVAASLRNADPAQEEVARSLGAGRLKTFWRVTIGQSKVAILGGCLLVVMVMLAEYGAFEILGYQTFTTEIFTEFSLSFNVPAACALSLVLIAIGLAVLAAEWAGQGRGRGRVSRVSRTAQRVTPRYHLGPWAVLALALVGGLVLLALGVPVGSAAYWWASGTQQPFAGVSLLDATYYTAVYSGCAAALATLMALPVAILVVRRGGRAARLLERSTYLVLAMPGLVIALSLSYFSERYGDGIGYQTAPMLILAYAIMFFPLALVGVRASVVQAPRGLEDVARTLGQRPLVVFWRVTRPLVTPGMAAAFCLVFLSAVTELTATLILVPTGVQTLATQFWNYEQNLAYGQCAPFALLMIAIAAVPSYVLGRYFDRLPARTAARGRAGEPGAAARGESRLPGGGAVRGAADERDAGAVDAARAVGVGRGEGPDDRRGLAGHDEVPRHGRPRDAAVGRGLFPARAGRAECREEPVGQRAGLLDDARARHVRGARPRGRAHDHVRAEVAEPDGEPVRSRRAREQADSPGAVGLGRGPDLEAGPGLEPGAVVLLPQLHPVGEAGSRWHQVQCRRQAPGLAAVGRLLEPAGARLARVATTE